MKINLNHFVCLLFISGMLISCSGDQEEQNFDHFVEQFADIKVLRYEIPGFEELTFQAPPGLETTSMLSADAPVFEYSSFQLSQLVV